jgi:hypothetical protein
VSLHQRPHVRLDDVAHDNQRGVVGLIVGVVEALAVLGGDPLQVLHGADGRPLVRVPVEGGRAEQLQGLAHRVVVDAQPLLLHHHLPLRVHGAGEELEVTHPIGLELEREAHVGRRHRLVVRGDVLGGEGVGQAAHLLEEAGVSLWRHALGPLEHHVLEHVGDAADARALLLGAHVIEDLDGGDGRLVLLDEQHPQAVGQRPGLDRHLRAGRRRGGRPGSEERASEEKGRERRAAHGPRELDGKPEDGEYATDEVLVTVSSDVSAHEPSPRMIVISGQGRSRWRSRAR